MAGSKKGESAQEEGFINTHATNQRFVLLLVIFKAQMTKDCGYYRIKCSIDDIFL